MPVSHGTIFECQNVKNHRRIWEKS